MFPKFIFIVYLYWTEILSILLDVIGSHFISFLRFPSLPFQWLYKTSPLISKIKTKITLSLEFEIAYE